MLCYILRMHWQVRSPCFWRGRALTNLTGEVLSKLDLTRWGNDWRKQRREYPTRAKEKTASQCAQQTIISFITQVRPHSFHFQDTHSSTPFNTRFGPHHLNEMALLAVKSRDTFQPHPTWSFSSKRDFLPETLFQCCSGHFTLQIFPLILWKQRTSHVSG